MGAVLLDGAVYEEVEADASATSQAFATVVLSGLAAGIGLQGASGSMAGVALIAALAPLSWALWAVIAFEIGAHILPLSDSHVDVGELLRTLGFATAPGGFMVLAVVRGFTLPVTIVTALWLLGAMTVALRQALDFKAPSAPPSCALLAGA